MPELIELLQLDEIDGLVPDGSDSGRIIVVLPRQGDLKVKRKHFLTGF